MKRLVLGTFVMAALGAQAASWQTDLNSARAQAKQEGKAVLINFTGSDWCGWCIKLKQEVFSQPQFDEYADKHLILVEIDFPKKATQSPAAKKGNSILAKAMSVSSFPTLVFLDRHGRELGRSGYKPGGTAAFIQEATRIVGDSVPSAAAPGTPPPPPPFAGATTFPPVRYTDLVLKNISGPENRRFALLNNQTFAQGDSAKVKMLDGEVQVHCLEIRAESVLVAVKGEPSPREIPLRR